MSLIEGEIIGELDWQMATTCMETESKVAIKYATTPKKDLLKEAVIKVDEYFWLEVFGEILELIYQDRIHNGNWEIGENDIKGQAYEKLSSFFCNSPHHIFSHNDLARKVYEELVYSKKNNGFVKVSLLVQIYKLFVNDKEPENRIGTALNIFGKSYQKKINGENHRVKYIKAWDKKV